MKIYLYYIWLIVLLGGCSGDRSPDKKNSIVFSCMVCSGCVYDNITYILENQLYSKYDVFLDSTCPAFTDGKLKALVQQLKYTQMGALEIEEEFGVFGNFILLDSTGNRIDFKTDMHLRDYIR